MKESGQRKKLFIDARVQGALLRQLIKHWLVACLLMVCYLLVLETFASGMRGSWSERFANIWHRYAPLLVVIVTMFPVFIYDSMRLSHRFAGPMVSIKKSLRKLANGEMIAPLRFRDGDFWKEMTMDFNRVAERLGLANTKEPTQ